MSSATIEQIRAQGLHALAKELGVVGMIRFLQQFETGHGDYSRERHRFVSKMGVETLAHELTRRRKRTGVRLG